MRVALVHDWLTGMRGGERVLSLACRMYPQADLLTLVRVPGACDETIESMRIITSPLSRLPGVGRYYRHLLPLMPWAVSRLDAHGYDLVLSFSHCAAKAVPRSPGSVHVCYCFTPMRYVWTEVGDQRGIIGEAGLRAFGPWLRQWDRRTAGNVDCFLANSRNTADRIKACYGRDAEVVYSPVNTSFYTPAPVAREDWYLIVSALTPYKRVDQAIVACGRTGRKLKVVGSGPERKSLERLAAAYPTVEMVGWVSDETLRSYYQRCRAFLMPQEEDFGLTPLEAMACGSPVISLAAGGALETTVDGLTGVQYMWPTVEGLVGAMERFDIYRNDFEVGKLVSHARHFGQEEFVRRFASSVDRARGAAQSGNLHC